MVAPGSRRSCGTRERPAQEAISMTARRRAGNSTHWAVTCCPTGPVTSRVCHGAGAGGEDFDSGSSAMLLSSRYPKTLVWVTDFLFSAA